jgi:RNA polymerase sigma factor (sigma-70 family)
VLLEHLPIVRFLARRIHERLPQHVDIEDLVSAGVVGLMDAFAKFDPTKKVQFRSYAQFRIRGAILDSLRTLDWSPRELRRKGRAVEEAIRVLTARLGHAPGEGEVAAEMGLGLEEYQQLLGDLKGLEIGTLHMERNEDSGEEELAYVPGRPEEDPLFRCLRGELEDRLAGRHRPSARPGAAGDDPLLLRGDDHARDRPGAGSGRVAGLAGACLGGGASAGRAPRTWRRAGHSTSGARKPPARRGAERAGVGGSRVGSSAGESRSDAGRSEGSKQLMEKTLKQTEIDALFRGRAQLDAGGRGPRCGPGSCPTTFPRPGRSRPSSCAPSAC